MELFVASVNLELAQMITSPDFVEMMFADRIILHFGLAHLNLRGLILLSLQQVLERGYH